MKSLPPDDDHCGELWDCLQHQSGQLWTRFWHQHIPRARFPGTLQLSLSKLELQKYFILCLKTIQLSLSKLDFQKNLSLFVCTQTRSENCSSSDNPHNCCGWQDRIPFGASRPGVFQFCVLLVHLFVVVSWSCNHNRLRGIIHPVHPSRFLAQKPI